MGQWLEQYGNTIYGTRGGPFIPTDWGVSTRKDDKIYLHILNWQGAHPEIRIPDIGNLLYVLPVFLLELPILLYKNRMYL